MPCPPPDWEALATGERLRGPLNNDLEQQVHDVWAKVLGTPTIGMHTDFFSAGGTSLLAGIAALQINDVLGTDLAAIDDVQKANHRWSGCVTYIPSSACAGPHPHPRGTPPRSARAWVCLCPSASSR